MKVPPKFQRKCRKKKNIPAWRKVILRDKVGKWKMIWKVKVPNNSIRPWEVIQKYLSRCLIVFNRIQRYKVRQLLSTLIFISTKKNAIQYFFSSNWMMHQHTKQSNWQFHLFTEIEDLKRKIEEYVQDSKLKEKSLMQLQHQIEIITQERINR